MTICFNPSHRPSRVKVFAAADEARDIELNDGLIVISIPLYPNQRVFLNELLFDHKNVITTHIVFPFSGTYISVDKHFRTGKVVPSDLVRREELNDICFFACDIL